MPSPRDEPRLAELLKRTDAIADGKSSSDNIPTGFPTLYRLLGGCLRRCDLIVVQSVEEMLDLKAITQ